jgi:biotin synthase
MPNLSPIEFRDNYKIYDNKAIAGEEAAESKEYIEKCIKQAGFEVSMSRGDHLLFFYDKKNITHH